MSWKNSSPQCFPSLSANTSREIIQRCLKAMPWREHSHSILLHRRQTEEKAGDEKLHWLVMCQTTKKVQLRPPCENSAVHKHENGHWGSHASVWPNGGVSHCRSKSDIQHMMDINDWTSMTRYSTQPLVDWTHSPHDCAWDLIFATLTSKSHHPPPVSTGVGHDTARGFKLQGKKKQLLNLICSTDFWIGTI